MNVLICDDDISVCRQLTEYLLDYQSLEVFTSHNSADIYEKFQTHNIQLLITDIELGEENGIEIAEKLQHLFPELKILFITGYSDIYYQDIFNRVNPTGFLEKPIQRYTLDFYIKQLEQDFNDKSKKIRITSNHREYLIPVGEILYFQSNKRKCEIITETDMYSCYKKLSDFEDYLPKSFIRCHNSYIINLKYVKSYQINHFCLINNELIPISDSRLKQARMAFYQNC